MIIGSLFSGIGGFELGLQRGLGASSVAWQVELDPWCRQVLARHWPDAARHDDVRTVGAHNLAPVDVLCGGFPCQDISTAWRGEGLDGARSGLWFEMLRVIREMQPRYVVAENVAALRTRGLPVVLAGLREAGYVASWAIIRASDLGAPHQRARLWIVAYRRDAEPVTMPAPGGARDDVWPRGGDPEPWELGEPRTTAVRYERPDRLRALGNAVVPQIPELIGQAIANAGAFELVVQGGGAGAWLPTPTATTYGTNTNPGAAPRPSLDQMARRGLWATPTVCGNYNRRGASPTSGDGLATQVAARQWPTIKASDSERGGRGDLLQSVRGNASPSGHFKSWPTPSASDDRDRGQLGKTPAVDRRAAAGKQIMLSMQVQGAGTLSPRWVELLMGYPLDWTTP